MKDKIIKFRVSTKQFDAIREKGGDNLSAWIVSKILPFDDLGDGVMKAVKVIAKDAVKPRQTVNDALDNHFKPKPKCASLGCPSRDTFPVDRRGTIFHLCQAHKP